MTGRLALRTCMVCLVAVVMVCAGVAGAFAGADIVVLVDGDRVDFPDQKPFIVSSSDRTYVPLRFVSEALGASVHWDGAAKTALVGTDHRSISMPVNSGVAVVNGTDTALDAPALLVNGRTVVPLRFVSEVLGAAVDWVGPAGDKPGRVQITTAPAETEDAPDGDAVPEHSWALAVGEADGRTGVRIESPVPFTHHVFTMTGPDRLVIDLAGVGAKVPADIECGSEAVQRVRTGFSENPPTGRVVCDLAAGFGYTRYRVEAGEDRHSLHVEIWTVDSVLADRTIVLDPGHGGADPGATGPGGLREKDVNLSVARTAARLLREERADVILTRTEDIRLGATAGEDLRARSRIANDHRADLFVSIHANASVSPVPEGTSVYFHAHPVNNAANVRLARALQASLVRTLGRKDLGVLGCNFYVLRYTDMPGALVEMAFISNPAEEQLLAQEWFQGQAAAAIVEGIKLYYGASG